MSRAAAVLGTLKSKYHSSKHPFDLKPLLGQPSMDPSLNVSLHLLKHVPSYTISSAEPHEINKYLLNAPGSRLSMELKMGIKQPCAGGVTVCVNWIFVGCKSQKLISAVMLYRLRQETNVRYLAWFLLNTITLQLSGDMQT